MPKQLFLVLNGKGGVGKSFFAVNFIQYLKDRGVPHVAIETDNENSTLKRFHPDADYIRIDREREIDKLFSALENDDLIVADCRAASTDIFLRYFSAVDLFDVLAKWLARLSLRHACAKSGEDERIPSYAEYRQTVELMDNRSKVFIGQAKDLLETMRLLPTRMDQKTFVLSALMAALGFAAGALTVLIFR